MLSGRTGKCRRKHTSAFKGKITVEPRDAYGDNRELTISLRDTADLFEWAETDEDLYFGIDRDDLDYIRAELLSLFSFGD